MSASANSQGTAIRVKRLSKPAKMMLLARMFHMLRNIRIRPILKLSFGQDP